MTHRGLGLTLTHNGIISFLCSYNVIKSSLCVCVGKSSPAFGLATSKDIVTVGLYHNTATTKSRAKYMRY